MTSGRVVLFVAAAVVGFAQARAAPLDADTCAKLKGEHSQLERAVEKDIEKGPEWAKANLAHDKLDRIQRFIELEEQLLFRCRDKSLVTLPTEQEQTPADTDDDEKKKAPADATPPPAKTPPATTTKKKTEPAKKPAEPSQAKQNTTKTKPKAAVKPQSGTGDPAPAAKAAPKAKVEDP
jgi:hypothetical protein